MLHGRFATFAALCLVWSVAAGAQMCRAEPAVIRSFNGPDTSWKLLDTGVPTQMLGQQCLPAGGRDNGGFERVVVAAPAGQSALLVCAVQRVAVLDELQIRLWVKAGRPDVQAAVRVVLPRSLDSTRRGPVTAIVRGTIFNRPGQWQELQVANVPKLLAEQVRVMRASPGASIDSHEAFVDAVVLITPGNPSGMEIGTDDLTVDGVLLPNAADAGRPVGKTVSPAGRTTTPFSQRPIAGGRTDGASAQTNIASATKAAAVRLQGTTLVVESKLFLPRVIPWNGEPLQFLSNCGFNIVQLRSTPTPEQSADAERNGLWFLCPPEHPEALARDGLGRESDRVLAWHLQDDALDVDPSYASRWAELVRERDAVFGRPIVIAPGANCVTTSRSADILIARHPRIGLLTPTEYASWLEAYPQRARPGTPLWVNLPTQADEALRRQICAFTHVAASPGGVDTRQLETSVQIACAHGARGFVFQSTSPLSETDEATRRRAVALQLINRRLQLMEPWLAGGKVVDHISSSNGAVNAILLHVDRAGLLVTLPNEDTAPDKITTDRMRPPTTDIVFTVPGVPETSQMFYLSPASMQTLPSHRIAGGTRVTLPAVGTGFVLMTEDPIVIQSLRRRIARDGPKTVQLEHDVAVDRARTFISASQRLAPPGENSQAASRRLATMNQQLAQMDSLLAAGQIEKAHEAAVAVTLSIDRAADEQRKTAGARAIFESDPLIACSDTIPEAAAIRRSIESLRPGDNLLLGGDFEDLAQMTQLGWQHVANPAAGVQSSAQLSAVEPQHGTHCLELNGANSTANARPVIVNNLEWIVSPPISVRPNQIVEISGWVRIDSPFAVGEGLEIGDSLGGTALALVIGDTAGWQPFRMIRVATDQSPLRITFSLAGLGTAKVDAVMVRTLEQPIARRLPPAQQISVPSAPAATGPVLVAPPTR